MSLVADLSAAAREAVLEQYGRAFEEHAIEEQLRRSKEPQVAWDHHEAGLIAIRGRMAEERSPGTIELPLMHCLECAFFYRKAASS